MKVIAIKNMFSPIGVQYLSFLRDEEDKHYKLVLNPQYANHFTSKTQAEEWIETKVAIDDMDYSIEDFPSELKKYNEWVELTTVGYIPVKNENLCRYYDKEKDAPIDVLNWWINFKTTAFNDGFETPYKYFKTWPDLYVVYNCIWGIGTYISREDEGLLIRPKLKVSNDVDFETFKYEFGLVSNLSTMETEVEYENKTYVCKTTDVFDDYLSEFGNKVIFAYNLEDDVYSINDRFGHELCTSNNLEKVFNWWKKHRGYNDND